MRAIERSTAFKRDFKKYGDIDTAFIDVLYKLVNDEVLLEKYRDHALSGDRSGYRECHVKPFRHSGPPIAMPLAGGYE